VNFIPDAITTLKNLMNDTRFDDRGQLPLPALSKRGGQQTDRFMTSADGVLGKDGGEQMEAQQIENCQASDIIEGNTQLDYLLRRQECTEHQFRRLITSEQAFPGSRHSEKQ
jgi:hypothetical protein